MTIATHNPIQETGRPVRRLQVTGAGTVCRALASVARAFGRAIEHRRKKRAAAELMALDYFVLKDMGIARSQIPFIIFGPPATDGPQASHRCSGPPGAPTPRRV